MNPYLVSAQDLLTYIRSPDEKPKSRPVSGTPGLSFVKRGSRWSFAFEHNGTRYHGTLGTYPKVSMKEAKAQFLRKRFAVECRVEPKTTTIPHPTTARTQQSLSIKHSRKSINTSHAPRFKDISTEYFRWRYDKLKAEGTNKLPQKAVDRMETLYHRFAAPVIDELPVTEISNSSLISILASISSETSRSKAKAMLSILIQWLIQKGMLDPDRTTINWQIITRSLPKASTLSKHYPRLAVEDIPRFVAYSLRSHGNFRDDLLGTYLTLLTLTAQRSGQIFSPDTTPDDNCIKLFSHWQDLDLNAQIWLFPPEYMKISQVKGHSLPPFRIPITPQIVYCLTRIKNLWQNFHITLKPTDFLAPQYDDPRLPQKAFGLRYFIEKKLHPKALAESGAGFFDPLQTTKIATVHGLRSCFADWAATEGYAENLIEATLAHTLPKVQRAYRRDDLLEARRPMMNAWGAYCFSLLSSNN